jgi:flagellar assembly protein FliH
LSSRIRSDSIIVGGSYVLGKDNTVDLLKDEILNTAKAQAEEIINQAQQQAQQITQEAEAQSQNMIAQAGEIQRQANEAGLQDGYNQGYQNGFNQISGELVNQIKMVDIIAKSSFRVKQEIIKSAKQDILELTIAIAEKILKNTLNSAPETILSIIKAAISELKEKEDIKISINPANAVHLYQYSEILKETVYGLRNLKIIEDKTIPVDGFIVESVDSRIDAGISTQIDAISRAFIKDEQDSFIMEEIPQEIEIKINEKIEEEILIYDN